MWKSQKNVCYLMHLVGNKINRIFFPMKIKINKTYLWVGIFEGSIFGGNDRNNGAAQQ